MLHRVSVSPTRDPGVAASEPPSKTPAVAFTVRQVPVSRTIALRQAVLRPQHEKDEHLALPGDDEPATVAFAALDTGDAVLAVARIGPEVPPSSIGASIPPGTPAWRLRGMATRPNIRNLGIGSAVLEAAIDHVISLGGGLLWCNARTPAIGLYLRAGFITFGEEWVDPLIGPHVLMGRWVLPD